MSAFRKMEIPNILLTNIRSLRPKFDEVRVIAACENPDVIALCETWLTQTVADEEVSISGYTLIRQDRTDGRRGGGVCAYVRCNLQFEIIAFPRQLSFLECLCVYFKTNDIIMIVIYVPPNLKSCQYTEVSDVLVTFCDTFNTTHFVIAGDVNQLPTVYLNQSLQLVQVVNSETRKTSILDKIFLSKTAFSFYYCSSCESGDCDETPLNIGPPIDSSDHNTVILKPCKTLFKCQNAHKNCSYSARVYDFRERYVAAFLNRLASFPWHSFYRQNASIDEKCHFFYVIVYSALESIPYQVVEMTGKEKSWFSPKLKVLINQRYAAFRNRNYELYNMYKTKIRKEIKQAKMNWISKLKRKPNGIWKVVSDTSKQSDSYSFSDESIEDINTALLSNFCPSSDWSEIYQLIENMDDNGEWNITVSQEKTRNYLEKLNVKKAAGFDEFPPFLAKVASDILAGPISHLIALSLETKTVPEIWKMASVTPIPKKKNPDVSDFRPISVLSVFTKVLEQYVIDSMKPSFIDAYGPDQYGFRPNHSTLHANIRVHDFITSSLDNLQNSGVLLMSFDMAKAFDRVTHRSLVESLINVAFPKHFLLWCCNFLQDRRQYVKVRDKQSSIVKVTSGIPQGGKLSPFLFCVHMSSLKPRHKSAVMCKYADDVLLALPICNSDNVDLLVETEMYNIDLWCSSHGLTLNREKTQCMLVRNRQVFSPSNPFFKDQLRILGVLFNSNLTWDSFVDNLCKRASRRLFILKRLKYNLSKPELMLIYNAVILSTLEYNAPLLIGINKKNSERLEKVRRRCHRIICGIECDCDRFTPLAIRREHLALKAFKGIIDYSDNQLHHLAPSHLTQPRLSRKLLVPYCRTETRRASFFPFCTALYNSMT